MLLKHKHLISIFILLCMVSMFLSCYEGDNTCYVCWGGGRCYNCDFKKPIDGNPCKVCKGTGICVNCNGTGTVTTHY